MPAVGEVENVFLYDLDSLHAAALAAVDRRREDIPAANEIVENEVDRYWRWVTGLASAPVVTSFRTRMDVLRRRELAAAQKHFGALTPEQNEAVELFSRALMNKFLHEPSVRLRAAAANGRGLGVIDAARYLFGIDEPTPVESSSTDSPE
jgi:glutamyl-tRNA reductase